MAKRYLILEDGSVYEGVAFGAPATTFGEIFFTLQ
ncbi:Carbamoyl-phosphate synthase small chain [Weissella viridescens]|uniref:Carbamoyl-phosphate synthase small chain n=1 Tax=Weissella viridescens TaxID=1629 RepID=A0A380P2U3_WEIVI|nr:Carbamoyl-phosphate synthase small chain [Weissella viridescens]